MRETRKGEAETVRGSGSKQVAKDVTDWVEGRRRTRRRTVELLGSSDLRQGGWIEGGPDGRITE